MRSVSDIKLAEIGKELLREAFDTNVKLTMDDLLDYIERKMSEGGNYIEVQNIPEGYVPRLMKMGYRIKLMTNSNWVKIYW